MLFVKAKRVEHSPTSKLYKRIAKLDILLLEAIKIERRPDLDEKINY